MSGSQSPGRLCCHRNINVSILSCINKIKQCKHRVNPAGAGSTISESLIVNAHSIFPLLALNAATLHHPPVTGTCLVRMHHPLPTDPFHPRPVRKRKWDNRPQTRHTRPNAVWDAMPRPQWGRRHANPAPPPQCPMHSSNNTLQREEVITDTKKYECWHQPT